MTTARDNAVKLGVNRALNWVAANLHNTRNHTGYGLTLGAVFAPEVISRGTLDREIRNQIRRTTLVQLLSALSASGPDFSGSDWPELRDKLSRHERKLSRKQVQAAVDTALAAATPPKRRRQLAAHAA